MVEVNSAVVSLFGWSSCNILTKHHIDMLLQGRYVLSAVD